MAPDGKTLDAGAGSLDPGTAGADDSAVFRIDTPPETLAAEARVAADFLKALGHEGRLLMLYHLCRRDHTVTELEQLIHSRQAAVSQQLARLRHERLVSTRREGNQIYYSLSDPRVRAMVEVIHRLFHEPD